MVSPVVVQGTLFINGIRGHLQHLHELVVPFLGVLVSTGVLQICGCPHKYAGEHEAAREGTARAIGESLAKTQNPLKGAPLFRKYLMIDFWAAQASLWMLNRGFHSFSITPIYPHI